MLRESMSSSQDTFARLVSLAVHDLRTPLATVSGFARTLQRGDLGQPESQYVQMMVAATTQLADLLEEVGLAARIEAGRWEPNIQSVDLFEVAQEAAAQLDGVRVEGDGGAVRVDRDAAATALRQLANCARRHGGVDEVTIVVNGPQAAIAPITEGAAPIVMGVELRDLGALIAARVVAALGGTLQLDGDRLLVLLA
jgi:signal transduction histidine kinase